MLKIAPHIFPSYVSPTVYTVQQSIWLCNRANIRHLGRKENDIAIRQFAWS